MNVEDNKLSHRIKSTYVNILVYVRKIGGERVNVSGSIVV